MWEWDRTKKKEKVGREDVEKGIRNAEAELDEIMSMFQGDSPDDLTARSLGAALRPMLVFMGRCHPEEFKEGETLNPIYLAVFTEAYRGVANGLEMLRKMRKVEEE